MGSVTHPTSLSPEGLTVRSEELLRDFDLAQTENDTIPLICSQAGGALKELSM